jgi:hypothetical protein
MWVRINYDPVSGQEMKLCYSILAEGDKTMKTRRSVVLALIPTLFFIWTFLPRQVFAQTGVSKSSSSNRLFKTEIGAFGVWYDQTKWKQSQAPDAKGKVVFQLIGEAANAVVYGEGTEVPISFVKEIVLNNFQKLNEDVKVILEEKRVVNGREILCLKVEGKSKQIPIPIISYGYYYGGKEGTIQVITFTGKNLFGKYEGELTNFLNGLVIQPSSSVSSISIGEKKPIVEDQSKDREVGVIEEKKGSNVKSFQSKPPASGASDISTSGESGKEASLKHISPQRASISGTVAIVFKSGDIKPVARRWFMVLPFSAFELTNKQGKLGEKEATQSLIDLQNEQKSGFTKRSELQSKKNRTTRAIENLQGQLQWIESLNVDELEKIYEEAEKENKAFKFQTDLRGQYTVTGIPPGTYHICDGLVRTQPRKWEPYQNIGRCYIHWEFVVTLAPGQSLKLDLSNDNAYDIWCQEN